MWCQFVLQRLGCHLMLFFLLGQIPKKLTRASISYTLRGLDIKAVSLFFHLSCGVAHLVDAKWAHQPVGLALKIAADMFATDQRDAFTEARAMPFNQRITVLMFFCRHLFEYFCRLRKLVTQTIGIREVNTCIILFRGYGQRQYFLFGERIKRSATIAKESAEHFKIPQFRIILKYVLSCRSQALQRPQLEH